MLTSGLKLFTMEENVQPPDTMYSYVYSDVVDETLNLASQAVYNRHILMSSVNKANIRRDLVTLVYTYKKQVQKWNFILFWIKIKNHT